MSTTLTQTLQELLDAAVRSVTVCQRDGQTTAQYTVEEWRQALRKVRCQHDPDTRLALLLCDVEVADHVARGALSGFLKDALRDWMHEDQVWVAPSTSTGDLVTAEDLSKKLLELAVVHSPAAAADTFMDSLENPRCQWQRMTILGGIKTDEAVELYDSVRIEPLPERGSQMPGCLPHLLTLPHPLLGFSGGEPMERFWGAALLVEDMVMAPRYMNPIERSESADESDDPVPTWNGKMSPVREEPRSAQAPDLDRWEFCNALSMTAKHYIFCSTTWHHYPDDELAYLSLGSSWGGGPILGYVKHMKITGRQIQEAKPLYESLRAMTPADRANLNIPITKLIDSWSESPPTYRGVVDLAVALESLFLPERNPEMAYRLQVRGARFLETDLVKRQETAKLLKAFYSARSKVVHTGAIANTYKVGDRKIEATDLVARTQDACLRSIRQIIDNGFPDWETVELG